MPSGAFHFLIWNRVSAKFPLVSVGGKRFCQVPKRSIWLLTWRSWRSIDGSIWLVPKQNGRWLTWLSCIVENWLWTRQHHPTNQKWLSSNAVVSHFIHLIVIPSNLLISIAKHDMKEVWNICQSCQCRCLSQKSDIILGWACCGTSVRQSRRI